MEHLLGIVKLPDRLMILLDMNQVLSRQDIAAINSADLLRDENGAKPQHSQPRDVSKEATPV